MTAYEKSLEVLRELFEKDCTFVLATARENVPSQRVVDVCYMGGAFWVVTHGRSAKVREMKANPCVSLCSSFHTFKCKAHFMGHPLLPANQAAREALAGAFEPWHFACNDEGDSNLCYLRIVPESGFFHKDGTGYRVDFINGTAAEFPFTAQVEMALQPRANIPVF